MYPGVLSEDTAILAHNLTLHLTGLNSLLLEVGINERRIVAVRNEADLLTIALVRRRQTELVSERADLSLVEAAERKQRAGHLLLLQTEEEVCLVLGVIDALSHLVAAGVRVLRDLRIVPCGNLLRANARGHVEKLVELDEVVAQGARDRGASG